MLSKDRALKKCNNALLEETSNTNSSPDLECNICLDLVKDPVVTFCGHLYCWPCIYKWIDRFRDASHEYQNPQCPVCKKDVSEDSLIPLYGRGQTNTTTSCSSSLIPQRPTSPICRNDSFLDYTRDYVTYPTSEIMVKEDESESRSFSVMVSKDRSFRGKDEKNSECDCGEDEEEKRELWNIRSDLEERCDRLMRGKKGTTSGNEVIILFGLGQLKVEYWAIDDMG